MSRVWDQKAFDNAYREYICQDSFPFGTPAYYARYKSRYRVLMQLYAKLAPPEAVDLLDVGGGQLALLAQTLWGDRASVSDLAGQPQLEYLAGFGVTPIAWNLCAREQPVERAFDFVFFSEVIEHLPIPGYIALEPLRKALKPGGTLICSTPNFYRARNVVMMALGRPVLEHMQEPGPWSLGHVIEYTREHLQWQIEHAGFTNCEIDYWQLHHSPTNPVYRVMSWIGYPIFLVPRFRDWLIATATAP